MTEYLVKKVDTWHLAIPGVIRDIPRVCDSCTRGRTGPHRTTCEKCGGTAKLGEDRRLRLAWFDRDSSAFLCFDDEEADVREMPE